MRDPIHPTRSPDEIAADNQAELEAWIEERAAELATRGLDPDQARRRAREEFGDIDTAVRYARRQDLAADRRFRVLRWLEEFRSDLQIATRTLARAPSVTVITLLTFALGIGATTAVFSLVQAMLLRPLPFAAEERLFYFQALDHGVAGPNPRFSAAIIAALRERTTSFTGIAHLSVGSFIIAENGEPEQLTGSQLSGNGFDVLGISPALGRGIEAGDEPAAASHVVVLGDDLWRRRYGSDPAIVGRTIAIGDEPWQVIGVMPPNLYPPTYEHAQFWVPGGLAGILAHPNARHVRVGRIFGRLKPGVLASTAQADVDRAMKSLQIEYPQFYGDVEARLVPIRTALYGSSRTRLLILMGAAGFVLLIACANVTGLLLSRALARRQELSVRMALGAGRRRLIRQFLAEGVVLATLGAGVGLLVGQIGIIALRKIAVGALPLGTSFALEPRVLLFAVAAAAIAALASSLIPAWSGTRGVGIALRRDAARSSPSRGSRRLRLGLVAGQLAVSMVLLIGAGLLVRTLTQLTRLDLGYQTERALTFRLPFTRPHSDPEQDAFYATLYAELRALPGVLSVAGGNVPLSGQSTVSELEVEGLQLESDRRPQARYGPASDDYFATLGIPILRGRGFTAADRDGSPWVALVSEGLARQLWPGSDPIGVRIRTEPSKPWATIVGVVGDVRMGGADAPSPWVYTSQRQDHWPGGTNVILRSTGDPVALVAGVRQVVKAADSTMPIVGLRTLDEFRRNTPAIAERRMQLQLMLVFALVALVVSAIGVYGMGAHAAVARRREFGIRMALGATNRMVLWLALGEGISVALLGVLVGIPLAALLARQLGSVLFQVAPYDPLTLGVVLGTMLLVVLAASLIPARRATLVDPAGTMRDE